MRNSNNQESLQEREREALPFFAEFARFSGTFAVMIATGLLALHAAGTIAGI